MNPTEPFNNAQNPSEVFGRVLQPSEDSSNLQSTSRRAGGVGRGKKYAGGEVPEQKIGHDYIIMEEAYKLFESEGERRSLRMIGEYCKTGELISFYDSDDKRWHISKESVENKITKIKALNARRAAAAPQNTAERFSEAPTTFNRTTEQHQPRSEPAGSSSEDFKKLEKQVLDLTIMNAGKDYLIDQLREERKELITRIETSSRLIGRLKTRLLQLMPGRPTQGNDTYAPRSDRSASPPESNVYRDVTLSDNTNDNYEYSPQEPSATE
jgi:hypothetical protein